MFSLVVGIFCLLIGIYDATQGNTAWAVINFLLAGVNLNNYIGESSAKN